MTPLRKQGLTNFYVIPAEAGIQYLNNYSEQLIKVVIARTAATWGGAAISWDCFPRNEFGVAMTPRDGNSFMTFTIIAQEINRLPPLPWRLLARRGEGGGEGEHTRSTPASILPHQRLCHNGRKAMFVILNPSPFVTLTEAKGLGFLLQDKLREESHRINRLEIGDSSAIASE